ncbi:excalibur calcium-binding domain-containing protein [Streptomyces sp. NPDC101490]|uniref:excalibur calcium-binding domain-containing protein n=1 Tax=Streptomyces sp. NPDC101490 TaxID=3366143 RepID=UPI00381BB30F
MLLGDPSVYPPPSSHPYPPPPPPLPPRPPVRRWWQRPALIIVLLVFFAPAGIALVWTSLWKQKQKIVATVLSGLWFLLVLLTPSEEKPEADAKAERPTATAEATPSATATPTPTPTPTPSKTPEVPMMPSLVGGDHAAAAEVLAENEGRVYAAYKDVELPAEHGTWLVCFQRPDAGAPVTSTVPVVYLTEPGVPCPASPNTVLHKPKPKPKPTPPPKPRPTTEPPTIAPEPEPTQESAYYRNCSAARAAGAAPVYRGDPGYGRHLDRDGDGVGCES